MQFALFSGVGKRGSLDGHLKRYNERDSKGLPDMHRNSMYLFREPAQYHSGSIYAISIGLSCPLNARVVLADRESP